MRKGTESFVYKYGPTISWMKEGIGKAISNLKGIKRGSVNLFQVLSETCSLYHEGRNIQTDERIYTYTECIFTIKNEISTSVIFMFAKHTFIQAVLNIFGVAVMTEPATLQVFPRACLKQTLEAQPGMGRSEPHTLWKIMEFC